MSVVSVAAKPQHDARRLLGFLAAVFVVRLVVVLQLHDHPLLQPDAGLDTSAYAALAARVRGGDLLLGPGLYFVSPLYIYFLAAALTLVRSFTAVRVLQAALGPAVVALVFVAAREWFGERAAWIAAAAAALTGVFAFYEALLLQAALDPFLTAAALGALAFGLRRHAVGADLHVRPGAAERRVSSEAANRRRRSAGAGPQVRAGTANPRVGRRDARWLFVAGLAFGIQTLNRPNVLLPAIVVLILLVAIRRVRGALLAGAGLAAALAPMAARNVIVSGVWSPLPSHGGLNFYIGNNAEADGTYHTVPGITPNIAGQEADVRRVAAEALGHPVTDAEASAYFLDRGFAWIRAHPGAAVGLFARKLTYTFNAAHVPLNDSFAFYAYDMRTLLAALVVGAGLLIPLGVTGLVIGAPRDRLAAYGVWASFVPAYAVSVAFFFAADRYRLPLLVPLCIGAGATIDWLAAAVRARRSPRPRPTPGSATATARPAAHAESVLSTSSASSALYVVFAVTVLFVFANWPLGLDDGRVEERTLMAEHFAAEGRVDEADRWAAQADTGDPAAALVHFRVGRVLLASHQPGAAVRHLERARQLDPGRAETDYALGEALLDDGRPRDAVPPLRRAVTAGVRPDIAGFDLARALAAVGERAGAIDSLARVTPANPRDAASWIALGDLAVRLDAPDLEEKFFTAAVAADPTNAQAHLNLAVVDAQRGRMDEARHHAERALQLKPDYEKARQLFAALAHR